MAIDKGYGSGKPRSAANSSMRRRAAAGQMTKGKKKMGQLGSYKTPGLEAANRRTSDSLLEAFTGFNKKDGVDAGDFAGLAISIPTGGLSGIARAVGRAVVPKAARIAGAATRVAKTAYKVEPSRFADAAAKSAIASRALTGVSEAGSEAYSNYLKMERRLGSGATDMLVGSEGKYIQRAKDASYKIANAASERAEKARSLALRTAKRTDTSESAAEIKRRLAALQRAKRSR